MAFFRSNAAAERDRANRAARVQAPSDDNIFFDSSPASPPPRTASRPERFQEDELGNSSIYSYAESTRSTSFDRDAAEYGDEFDRPSSSGGTLSKMKKSSSRLMSDAAKVAQQSLASMKISASRIKVGLKNDACWDVPFAAVSSTNASKMTVLKVGVAKKLERIAVVPDGAVASLVAGVHRHVVKATSRTFEPIKQKHLMRLLQSISDGGSKAVSSFVKALVARPVRLYPVVALKVLVLVHKAARYCAAFDGSQLHLLAAHILRLGSEWRRISCGSVVSASSSLGTSTDAAPSAAACLTAVSTASSSKAIFSILEWYAPLVAYRATKPALSAEDLGYMSDFVAPALAGAIICLQGSGESNRIDGSARHAPFAASNTLPPPSLATLNRLKLPLDLTPLQSLPCAKIIVPLLAVDCYDFCSACRTPSLPAASPLPDQNSCLDLWGASSLLDFCNMLEAMTSVVRRSSSWGCAVELGLIGVSSDCAGNVDSSPLRQVVPVNFEDENSSEDERCDYPADAALPEKEFSTSSASKFDFSTPSEISILQSGLTATVAVPLPPRPPGDCPRAARALMSLPGNRNCVECNAVPALWASINLGVTLCDNCAGAHRSLGTHISQVRSLTLDTWTPKMIEGLWLRGNEWNHAIYEGKGAPSGGVRPRPSSPQRFKDFLKRKYVGLEWAITEVPNESIGLDSASSLPSEPSSLGPDSLAMASVAPSTSRQVNSSFSLTSSLVGPVSNASIISRMSNDIFDDFWTEKAPATGTPAILPEAPGANLPGDDIWGTAASPAVAVAALAPGSGTANLLRDDIWS